ncbi:MAG TPA: type III-B CRISPR module RAMP protein Cmr6, partial [Desulfobacterales bacterium]|nr:type III-B CRISPR module RAMP protein Cmr6 [Desulfobacterales bacterium]
MTAIRPINKEVREALGILPTGPFNFGLFFQKWFYVSDRDWQCPTHDTQRRRGDTSPLLLDNLPHSLTLFNGGAVPYENEQFRWDLNNAALHLQKKHDQLDSISKSYENIGYKTIKLSYNLKTFLIIGLGNEHPTEKGFRFDWNLGIPVIPASSIKGLVRLAYLVNCLDDFDTEEGARAFAEFLLKGKLPELGRRFFGVGADQEARRGRVIFLDAYPAALPRLKAEIMNCHYSDYYQGERGPTEDQSTNPQKFWAVDTLESNGKPLQFIFRLMVHNSLAQEPSYLEFLEKALDIALQEHGLGAKTAIGHGRFGSASTDVAPKSEAAGETTPVTVATKIPAKEPPQETWEKATLTWDKG